jgi:hypothetical protein
MFHGATLSPNHDGRFSCRRWRPPAAVLAALLLTPVGCLAAAPPVLGATPERPAYHRWATLASRDLDEAGLTDLLAVELAKRADLETVERQQVGEVLKELKLATLFGADAAARLNLGHVLKADALVLLSLEEHEK